MAVSAGNKLSDVRLPLEIDEAAPQMTGKMAQPSLQDVNYMLNRWAHAWDKQRAAAVQTRAAMDARPVTPSKTLRPIGDVPMYGYPLAPVP